MVEAPLTFFISLHGAFVCRPYYEACMSRKTHTKLTLCEFKMGLMRIIQSLQLSIVSVFLFFAVLAFFICIRSQHVS